MIALIEGLNNASALLHSALDAYLGACAAIQGHYQQTNTLTSIPREVVDRVANELPLVTSYETKIRQAKSTIGQAMNSTITPINTLPSEILIRIFHLVVDGKPCGVKYNSGEKITLPKYPDFLSYVCTRWRQLVVHSPTLWSHIDLVPFSPLSRGFETRAEVCVTRANNLLLDLHVYEPAFCEQIDIDKMLDLLVALAPRVKSLELAIPDASEVLDKSVIECCFGNCSPGTFTRLILTDHGSNAPTFLWASDDPDDLDEGWLDIPSEKIDNLLLPVTDLLLDGIYLPWTHQAYHGLVELRLTSTRKPVASITESELVNILSLSPRLKILHFGLTITAPLPKGSSIPPVRLDDLEILNLTSPRYAQLSTLLRLLAPGSNPLRVSLEPYSLDSPPLHMGEVKDFFARSNVAELHIRRFPREEDLRPGVNELIDPNPNLRILAMSDAYWKRRATPIIGLDNQQPTTPRRHLDALYIINSRIELDELERVITQYPVKMLVFWGCRVYEGRVIQSSHELQTKLSRLCSDIRCIPWTEDNPTEGWDYVSETH